MQIELPQKASMHLYFSFSSLLHDQSAETSRMSHILSSIRAFRAKWMVTKAITKSVPSYCCTVDLNISPYILRNKTVYENSKIKHFYCSTFSVLACKKEDPKFFYMSCILYIFYTLELYFYNNLLLLFSKPRIILRI